MRPVGAADPGVPGPRGEHPDQEQRDDARGGAASGGNDTAISGSFLPEDSWPRLRGAQAESGEGCVHPGCPCWLKACPWEADISRPTPGAWDTCSSRP